MRVVSVSTARVPSTRTRARLALTTQVGTDRGGTTAIPNDGDGIYQQSQGMTLLVVSSSGASAGGAGSADWAVLVGLAVGRPGGQHGGQRVARAEPRPGRPARSGSGDVAGALIRTAT